VFQRADQPKLELVQLGLLALVVISLPLLIGGAPSWALAPAAVIACVAACVGLGASARGPWPRAHQLLLVLAAVMLGLTLLQCVPLPMGLLRLVAPATASTWERAMLPLGLPAPSFATLSLDPVATRLAALRGLLYLGVLFASVQISATRAGVLQLERTVLFATTVMAFVALVHSGLGLKKVFGIYEPENPVAYLEGHIAPLLNTNHLAGYLNIGFALAVGALLSRRPPMPRALLASGAAVMLAASVWSSSRGGMLGILTALVVNAALRLRGQRGVSKSLRGRFAQLSVATMVLGATVMVSLAFGSVARAKFSGNRDFSKLEVVAAAFRLFPEHPVFGVGRGAFESVFPSLGTTRDNWVSTHPENIVAQWLTEWGIFGALGLVAFAATLLLSMRWHSDPACRGAGAALAGAFVHNLVDFHDEMPGVAVSLAVCAALFTARPGRPKSHAGVSVRVRAGMVAAATFAGILGTYVILFSDHELGAEHRSFQTWSLDRQLSKAEFHERLQKSVLRHPADPYLPYAAAVRATMRRDESPIPFLARALERNPTYGRAHLVLARNLFARVPSQARMEYRLAYAYDRTLRDAVAQEVSPLVGDYYSAVDLVPEGREGIELLDLLSSTLEARLPATSFQLDDELLRRDSKHLGALGRRAKLLEMDLQQQPIWCDGTPPTCLAEALRVARQAAELGTRGCEHPARLGNILVMAGRTDDALKELQAYATKSDDRSSCLSAAFEIASKAKRTQQADQLLGALSRAGCVNAATCASNLAAIADMEVYRGNVQRGVALYRQAMEHDPEREDLLLRYANLTGGAGLHAQAAEAYSRLAQRHPEQGSYAAQAAEHRAAMQAKAYGDRFAPKR